jgi:ABC-2 type transport system permease protein
MGVILATVKKELISYLFSPVAYVIAVVLYFARGVEIYNLVLFAAESHLDTTTFATYYAVQGNTAYLFFVLVPPILTMRCFAEEKRTGSLEVLMTAPVRDIEIVVGKWVAAVVFFGMLWLPTLPILTLLSSDFMLDQSISYGIVLSSYVGLFLLGSMLLSVGIFTSSLTDNVLLAAIIAMIFNVMMIMAPGFVHPRLEEWFGDTYMVNAFIEQTSVFDHLRHWFGRGMIDSSKVMFYLGGCALFLFLTVRSLESRKWQ